MKYVILMLLVILTTSCVYQHIDSAEVKLASDFCEDKEGLKYIEEHFLGITSITCNNGEYIREDSAYKKLYQSKKD